MMKNAFRFLLTVVALLAGCCSLSAQSQAYKGWPGHDDISDLKACFANPPKGYGNVPFYWWTGDPLDLERMTEQLEILSEASTSGLCVSYNHTHADVDTLLNAAGHGPCGRVSGGEPRVMSPQWRGIWNEFSKRCAANGIGLGMDDYVIAWPKNGEFIDSILAQPAIKAYQGALIKVRAADGKVPDNALTVAGKVNDSTDYICSKPAPWLHPDLGAEIVDKYFQPFEDSMDPEALEGMNYFFQDELQYDLNIRSWCEDMPEEFLSRKGYDIVPLLPKLFIEDASQADAEAVRVRLDYAEVLTQLAEERYFKPIYEWNASRGLIYGCDQEGRGLRPLRYLDYFRAVSWFTAPGNDAPARGSSFRQTKVSSSIAHLYGRPRTWLEAFHSMGWDANGALLKTQLDHHIIAGGNLLCMHGLYYSTHGGWWEWAPPCFHFRMPYWEHMKLWLKYAERMCFLLSQGRHVCDITLLYPTETMQAIPGTDAKSTFAVSEQLSIHGLDYDFIDYQSLQRSSVRDASLDVAGESYRVLVLVDTRAMHSESLEKVCEFIKAGGIVLAVGETMPELTAAGVRLLADDDDPVAAIRGLIEPDFRTSCGEGRVLHRRIGERDVYMIMNVHKGDSVYFRCSGMVESWDAMDGSTKAVPVISQDENGTWIRYSGEPDNSMLVVFSPGTPLTESENVEKSRIVTQAVAGEWEINVIPTMNNRWGDFRLPASDEYIGVEAREMRYPSGGSELLSCYGYGPYMETCNVPSDVDLSSALSRAGSLDWSPYVWSWQYGVADSPGSQGWHGLKSKVDARFLILDQGVHQLFRTNVYAPSDGRYRIVSEGVSPDAIMLDGEPVVPGELSLKKGWHSLIVAYASTRKTEYSLRGMRSTTLDRRDRGMVMIYPADAPEPVEYGLYDSIVASKWYGTRHLIYNAYPLAKVMEFTFDTAPGTEEMRFSVNGKVYRVEVDGKRMPFVRKGDEYMVRIASVNPGVSEVTVHGRALPSSPGAAFFSSPVRMKCATGKVQTGDWTRYGALRYFSGAVKYSKDIVIDGVHSSVILDLGEVDATCDITVNGLPAGILIGKPYSVDITRLVKPGVNRIEVKVCSSLSNHYSTIPSPYRGTPHAGLIGPVMIIKDY